MFQNQKKTDQLEVAEDRVGGFQLFESNVYEGRIKMFAGVESDGGAKGILFTVETNGREYSETIYVTSGREKGQKNYYIDTKNGNKERPLPGWTLMNDVAMCATGGTDLTEVEWEKKTVEVYSSADGKKIPKELEVATDLIGKTVLLGILHKKENKTKKNDNTGKYEPIPGEFREFNAINAVFDLDTQKTVREAQNDSEAKFHDKWLEANKGKIVSSKLVEGNGSGGNGGNTGRPQASNSGSSNSSDGERPSLFKKKS
ncbi:ssDNA-binding protein [Stenotrophomonas phage Philippe]|uniref:SsDNA-binding protein n=1 Tax=Stenotrophomonas phage Philippe TaxID=2859655 RepID=A0AAE7WMW4_9CAUD|nr:ssDNA-binding protein [Stenotrophomonas phage Philippe]QYW02267.1 ssDNA-binding protein [Stenotrophomonas phage Philippe]